MFRLETRKLESDIESDIKRKGDRVHLHKSLKDNNRTGRVKLEWGMGGWGKERNRRRDKKHERHFETHTRTHTQVPVPGMGHLF